MLTDRSAIGAMAGSVRAHAGHAKHTRAAAAVLCLLVAVAAGAIPDGLFDATRNWLFDFYQRAAPAQRTQPPIIIIDIDSASLAAIGQWPWPRDQLAKLIDATQGARAVGVDILLAEPDRSSPGLWAANRPDLSPDIRTALGSLPSDDAVLAAAIAHTPVVLAALAETGTDKGAPVPMPKTALVESGGDPRPELPRFTGLLPPLPELAAASRGIGVISVPVEADGVLRRMPAIAEIGSTLVPAFAVALAGLADGPGYVTVQSGGAGLKNAVIGDKAIRCDPQGRVWLRYADPLPVQSVPAYRVLKGDIDSGLFRDRIVLIGTTAPGLGTLVATPLRHAEDGVAVQAQLIATLLAGDALWRPRAIEGFELVLAFALGVCAIFLLGRLPGQAYIVLLAGFAVSMVVGSFLAFRSAGLLIDWTFPATIFAGTAMTAFALRLRRETADRRRSETIVAAALQKAEFARQIEEQARQLETANAQLKDEIAERQRMEEQLIHGQRMEAIGQLTGGIAHDFNNLLTAVLGNLDLALRREMTDDARHHVVRATSAAERSARLASHLLAFGRKQFLTVRAVDLNQVVSRVEEMLARTLAPGVEIVLTLAPDLWPAFVDGTKLELALVNLAINARDAMPNGGTVTVATRNVAAGDPDLPDDLAGSAGRFVVLTVGDTGTGMTEAVKRRAFEPFFTTKQVGQGSGLGLSMVYGLTKQLGGTVRLESRLGQGTEVSLFLPYADEAAREQVVADASPRRMVVRKRAARVMLVEDNDAVREAVAATLRELGHHVVEVEDGAAALEVLGQDGPVDVLIADIVMPGLPGAGLASKARCLRPNLPVLLITGHPGDVPETIDAEKLFSVLRKPFRPEELGAMIDRYLPDDR